MFCVAEKNHLYRAKSEVLFRMILNKDLKTAKMKSKVKIISIFGNLLFEFEKENNTVKDTVVEAIKNSADLRSANLSSADLRSADLSSADLRSANLSFADLRSADLSFADLRSAHLISADLRSANLSFADLRSADLRSADLSSADLSSADLRSADLRFADLSSADLRSADLCSADLSSANLRFADLKKLISVTTIVPEGELIVWKKLRDNLLAKLLIPVKAKRVNAIGHRKCRFDFADVLAIYNGKKKVNIGYSKQQSDFVYEVGKRVVPDSFDPSPLIECSNGISAFITKQEAIDY